jgi:hypothetical protein
MIAIIELMDFRDWIFKKYQDWSDNGKRSETQFALWLGVNSATFNAWKLRTRGNPRSKEIIDKLADKLGPEVYDVLGLPRPEAQDFADRLRAALREAFTLMIERGISPGTPKADDLIAEISDRFEVESTHISKK